MKIRVSLFSLLCGFAAVSAARAADDTAAPAKPAPAPMHKHEDQTELGEHMEKVGGAFRRLNKQVADPAKNEDSLKQVHIIRTNAEAVLNLKPEKMADIPEADRAAFLAKYQEQMKKFIGDVEKLEAALKAGKNDEATVLVKKTMKQDMDEGHKEFRKKKDRM